MTNIVYVLGSTITDAVSKANASWSATDYISDLTVGIEQANSQTTGSSILVGFVKNNGHFAGFRGSNRVTAIGGSGATAATLTSNLQPTDVNRTIVDMDCAVLGSDSTGSNVYFAVALERNFNA